MEGTAISSLTIPPPKTKFKNDIRIKDPSKVMELGYVSFSVDTKAVEKALQFPEQFDELGQYIEVQTIEEDVPARLKINKKRSSAITTDTMELLIDDEKAA